VSTLARDVDPHRYTVSACFLGSFGPLVEHFRAQKISARVINWRHPHRDPLALYSLWRELREQHFDIVHIHWGGRGVRWVASRAGNSKVLFHLHARMDESIGFKPIEVRTDNSDIVVAVSHAVAATSIHPNTKVIHTGVPQSDIARATPVGMKIGTAGRLLKLKGLSYLLRAISVLRQEFPDLRLQIAGDGPEHSKLQQEIGVLGLTDIVEFLGWLPDINSVLQEWQIFVQPSLEEGLPVAVLEAMSSKLPVVASAVGGLPEIIQDGITGRLVPPADPEALASCLRPMLLNLSESRRMGEAGAIRVSEHFSSQRMVDEISKVYDELLD
jgi:glycosyltransferase involved in cell wall biosynthesis